MPVRSFALTKQHVFPGERLQAFSDAVFSIIATFSIIPLKFSRGIVKSHGGFEVFDLEQYLYGQWNRYLIYLYSFSLVADVWFIHTGVFSIVEHVDDVIIWLNLLLLFVVSFLPYATSLISSYSSSLDAEQLAISICAGDILLISVTMMIILGYAYRRQSYLHPEIVNNSNIRTIKIATFIALLIKPILAVLAIGFSFLSNTVPWLPLVLFYSIGVVSIIIKLIFYTIFRLRKSIDRLPQMVFRTVANKHRTEAFSDGVFAIVATLIVLDLTTEHFPKINNSLEGALQNALFKQRFVFLSYMTTFMITGLLWFVQYSMFHFIKKFTPALSVANIATLFVVGGIPFVAEINSVFSDETFTTIAAQLPNRILSIRLTSVIVTLAGISQLIFWSVAHHQKSYCMSDRIENSTAEMLVFVKTMVIPVFGIIAYWGTFDENFISYHLYTALTFATPFVFLFLEAMMKCVLKFYGAVGKLKKKTHEVASSVQHKDLPSPVASVDSLDIPLLEDKERKEYMYTSVEIVPDKTE